MDTQRAADERKERVRLRYPAGQDRGATLASRVGEFLAGADFGGEEGVDGKVSESSVGKTALSGCRGPNPR
jgi:hypothetical protein